MAITHKQCLPISVPAAFPSALSCCTAISPQQPGSERSSDYTWLQSPAICSASLQAFIFFFFRTSHNSDETIRRIGWRYCWHDAMPTGSATRACVCVCFCWRSITQRVQRLHCVQKVTRLISAEADVCFQGRGSAVKRQ